MKGDLKVVETLNEVLSCELTVINQYFLHARMLKNWGFAGLAKKVYHHSIEAMKDASDLTDRILLLEGLPNFQKIERLLVGQKPEEVLRCDLSATEECVKRIRAAIVCCYAQLDHGTREMLERMIEKEEEALDFLETQQHLITELGLQNYLAEQIGNS